MTEQKKDYSLLRPFDLEAAKAGDEFLLKGEYQIRDQDNATRKYIAGPDINGRICIQFPSGELDTAHTGCYVMKPLAWVEGKPVYKGDVLYLIGAVDDLNKQPLKVESNHGGWWCRDTIVNLRSELASALKGRNHNIDPGNVGSWSIKLPSGNALQLDIPYTDLSEEDIEFLNRL